MSIVTCPDCGRPLPVNAPAGFCPVCVLRLAQSGTPGPSGEASKEETKTRTVFWGKDETVGAQIGRYKLLEIIGEGGFGTVWMAEQTEPVRRRVALKIIKLGMDTKLVVARFEAERQALALMDHPNIARVFDAGATQVGRPYFVMELVRGLPITEFCDARRLNTLERINLLVAVCQAVQHAHQKGVIHRDLKPSNILVAEQDGRAVPKIIDFGVAKAISEPLTEKTLFTRFHQFLGTPAYMSPEQAGLGGLDVDTRTDIYALGVLLYELLTGQLPLGSQEWQEAGREAVLRTIREVEPPKPSTRLSSLQRKDLTTVAAQRREDPERLFRLVRGDLDWIVLKAMDKDRARRYETANGLAADLRRFLQDDPIVARPPTPLYRLQKLARRHQLVFAGTAAIVATLVAGLVATTWQARRAEHHLELARLQAYAAEMNAAYRAWEAGRVVQARNLLARQRPVAGSDSPDFRGFDWRYLWGVTRPSELDTLTNVTTWGFAISEDGKTLVGKVTLSGDPALDGRLQCWNLKERRKLAEIATDTTHIFNAAFAPDGKTVAVPRLHPSRTNGCWELREVTGLRLVKELPVALEPLGVAFSPDGTVLASSSGHMYETNTPGELRLFNLKTDSLLRPPLQLPQWAYQVTFSPNGQSLAVSCGDGVARVLEVPSGNERMELPGHNGFVTAVAFTHDGARLVTGDERGYVRVWDLERGYPETVFKAHDGPIYQISITADDQRLVTASRDFTAGLWERRSGRELARFLGHNGGVTSVRLLPGDQSLVTASLDRNVKVWSAQPRATVSLLTHHQNNSDSHIVSHGRYVAVVDWKEHSTTFFDTATGMPRLTVPGQALAASEDGQHLAVLAQDNVVFYDPIRLTEIDRFKLPTWGGGRSCFSPNGRFLALRREVTGEVADQTRVVIIDVARRRIIRELETDDGVAEGWAPLYFARSGKLLLTIRTKARQVVGWDTTTWQRVKLMDDFPSTADVAVVSPDGRLLAAAGFGGKISLWDLEHLKSLEPIDLGTGNVYSLGFDPDNRTLAVGWIDGTIRLWSLSARQELATFRGHFSVVPTVEFSPDGRTLVSKSYDATIRVWRAPLWEEIETSEASGIVSR
jgi:eukaryotic-like serine/threonine-protein kinase